MIWKKIKKAFSSVFGFEGIGDKSIMQWLLQDIIPHFCTAFALAVVFGEWYAIGAIALKEFYDHGNGNPTKANFTIDVLAGLAGAGFQLWQKYTLVY